MKQEYIEPDIKIEALISFTDIWADDEETVNVNWDSFD